MGLKVQVPKRFGDALSKRFNYNNRMFRNESYYIKDPCPLCEIYLRLSQCGKCPFSKFKKSDMRGCIQWIEDVIGHKNFNFTCDYVEWHRHNDKEVKKQLAELRKRAKELIEWV